MVEVVRAAVAAEAQAIRLRRGSSEARASRAQRGARISSTGWRGGTRPSGRSGRKVAQGSVQLQGAEEVPAEVAVLAGGRLPRSRTSPALCQSHSSPDRNRFSVSPACPPTRGHVSTAARVPQGQFRKSLLSSPGPVCNFPALCGHPLSAPTAPLRSPAMGTHERSERLAASPEMFDSAFLNFFSRVHPAVPAIVFVPVVVAMEWLGADRGLGLGALLVLTLGGVAIWTLTEYWLHRLIFHWEPDNDFGHRMHFIIHGVHHDHPNDKLRLVMPPAVSIPLAALFYGAFFLLFGSPDSFPLFAGLHRRLPDLRLHALLRAPLRPEVRPRQASCASSTCATTSRTTATASAFPRRSGTQCSARCRGAGAPSATRQLVESPCAIRGKGLGLWREAGVFRPPGWGAPAPPAQRSHSRRPTGAIPSRALTRSPSRCAV